MKWLSLFAIYFPVVLQGVVAVEAALKPLGAKGADKKAVVLAAIQAGAQSGEAIPEGHVAAISALIDHVVSSLNSTGVFAQGAAKP